MKKALYNAPSLKKTLAMLDREYNKKEKNRNTIREKKLKEKEKGKSYE